MVDINLFEADANTNTEPTLAERVAARKAAKKKRTRIRLPRHTEHTAAYRKESLYWRKSNPDHTAAFKEFLSVFHDAEATADNTNECLAVIGCGPIYLRGLMLGQLPFFHTGSIGGFVPLMHPIYLEHFIVRPIVPLHKILTRCATSQEAIAQTFHYTNLSFPLTKLGAQQQVFERDTPMPPWDAAYDRTRPRVPPMSNRPYLTIAECYDKMKADIAECLRDRLT